jgi:hypothetical protein
MLTFDHFGQFDLALEDSQGTFAPVEVLASVAVAAAEGRGFVRHVSVRWGGH